MVKFGGVLWEFCRSFEIFIDLRSLRSLSLSDSELHKSWESSGVFQEFLWKAYENFSLIYPSPVLLGRPDSKGGNEHSCETCYMIDGPSE